MQRVTTWTLKQFNSEWQKTDGWTDGRTDSWTYGEIDSVTYKMTTLRDETSLTHLFCVMHQPQWGSAAT